MQGNSCAVVSEAEITSYYVMLSELDDGDGYEDTEVDDYEDADADWGDDDDDPDDVDDCADLEDSLEDDLFGDIDEDD